MWCDGRKCSENRQIRARFIDSVAPTPQQLNKCLVRGFCYWDKLEGCDCSTKMILNWWIFFLSRIVCGEVSLHPFTRPRSAVWTSLSFCRGKNRNWISLQMNFCQLRWKFGQFRDAKGGGRGVEDSHNLSYIEHFIDWKIKSTSRPFPRSTFLRCRAQVNKNENFLKIIFILIVWRSFWVDIRTLETHTWHYFYKFLQKTWNLIRS